MQRPTREIVSLSERAFLLGALAEGLRGDGRGPFDARRVRLWLGPAPGAVEVTLGDTRVLGRVTAELVEPFPDRPTEGSFAMTVELSPMASGAFEAGRPSPYAIELSRVIERAIVKSHAVDLEALCVLPGQKVWAVRCDVTVVDHCGNLLDACTLAAGVSLRHFRRPYVRIHRSEQGEATSVEVCAADVEEPEPLALRHMPLGFTFALVHEDDSSAPLVLLDASEREEAISSGSISVLLNQQGELCALHKAGGVAVAPEQIRACAEIARERFDALAKVVNEALDPPAPAKAEAADPGDAAGRPPPR